MMIVYIIILSIFMLSSFNSVKYLINYLKLANNGIRIDGKIVSFENSKHIMTKTVPIPKIKFDVPDGTTIIGKPIYSWLLELNNFNLKKECVIYYDKDDPNIFVYKSNIEMILNIALVFIMMIGIIRLINASFRGEL